MAIIMIKKQNRLLAIIISLSTVFCRCFLALLSFDIIIYSQQSCNQRLLFF